MKGWFLWTGVCEIRKRRLVGYMELLCGGTMVSKMGRIGETAGDRKGW